MLWNVPTIRFADGHEYMTLENFIRLTRGLPADAEIKRTWRESAYNRIRRGTLHGAKRYGMWFIRKEH
jgi:hypothetical protein